MNGERVVIDEEECRADTCSTKEFEASVNEVDESPLI